MTPVAYVGLFAAVIVTWLAIAGPGEAALVSAGVIASRGRVDIAAIIAIAFAGAVVGNVAGYWVGRAGGRRLMLRPGPFLRTRTRALEKGERLVHRRAFVASLLAPSWLAGINAVRLRTFVAATAISGLAWTLSVGLGAFFVGPSLVRDIDTARTWGIAGAVAVAVIVGLVVAVRRARRPQPVR